MSKLPPTLPTFVPNARYTLEQWERIEEATGMRYEFHDGFLVNVEAMAGGSYEHARLAAHFIREAGSALIQKEASNETVTGCDALTSDLRIAVDAGRRYLYADATIVCGTPVYDKQTPTAIANPIVVCEVLSPSSEGYDRGVKFDYYGGLESLREYVTVRQDRHHVEVRTRTDSASPWQHRVVDTVDGSVALPSLDITLPMTGLYRNWEQQH